MRRGVPFFTPYTSPLQPEAVVPDLAPNFSTSTQETPTGEEILLSASESTVEPLRIDPKRVVIICLRGFGGISSSAVPPVPMAIVEERSEEDLEVEEAVAAEWGEEVDLPGYPNTPNEVEKTNSPVALELEEAEARAWVEALSSAKGGMETLRNTLAKRLQAYKVPLGNIIYTKWTEDSDEKINKQPTYKNLVNKIVKLNPSYLAIIGHSYGGCTAVRLSVELAYSNIKKVPDFVGLVDPIFVPVTVNKQYDLRIPESLLNYPIGKIIVSWYQTEKSPLGFQPVRGGMKNKNERYPVKNVHLKGVTHTTIDDDKALHSWIVNTIVKGVGGIAHAATLNEDERTHLEQPPSNIPSHRPRAAL